MHLCLLPWELVVHLLYFLLFVAFETEKVKFLLVVGCIYLGLDIVFVDKVLIFIMVLLLRLVYILRIPHNLLLIIGMKEVRYKVPLEILRIDVINRDQVIVQPWYPWRTTSR